ncbi:peptide-methionine (S)-S-oxide reductase MsrA [Accumulibacter sp.]|uniref:peptide-methionine (S)-S-oxide reductase MsrA n=1 Tax=Accumulibacter sp. TaxID=2053492 RepID=UPI0035AFF2C8
MSARRLLTALSLLVLGSTAGAAGTATEPTHRPDNMMAVPSPTTPQTAIFAGGCFWCIEADFEKLPGVIAVESGYTAGQTVNPTYEQVSAGGTGHTEAVRVRYDAQKVSYSQLVEYFWRHIDPTVKDRQFCDVGSQYRSGIYWQNDAERKIVESSRDALLKSGKIARIETELQPASTFYLAEEYHQDYYKKNPVRYAYYRSGCGRDIRVQNLWGSR